jgi:hypothetical protein
VSSCPACAEAVAPGMTRCPHCGESFVLPPLPRQGLELPPALRTLAWSLLALAALRTVSLVPLILMLPQLVSMGAQTLVTVFGAQLVHTALIVAAGVGLLQARSWGPLLAWLQVASTLFSLGSFVLAFVGVGFGLAAGAYGYGALLHLASLVVAAMTAVVLVRPDVRAVFRKG